MIQKKILTNNSILKRNKLFGYKLNIDTTYPNSFLSITNCYGRNATGLVNFLYDLHRRKKLFPVGNKFALKKQCEKLITIYGSESVENAIIEAAGKSKTQFGFNFVERLLKK